MDQIRQRPDDFLDWLLRNPGRTPRPNRAEPIAMSKTRARALLRIAAKVLTREEMAQAVQDTYAGRAGSKG
ncbi:MAG TPA: hypothetical protein VN541_08990 [Tepidisphaeraceae bacterium]|nr:hypothetical protein [Tepidisphaeraceae bacterium]